MNFCFVLSQGRSCAENIFIYVLYICNDQNILCYVGAFKHLFSGCESFIADEFVLVLSLIYIIINRLIVVLSLVVPQRIS